MRIFHNLDVDWMGKRKMFYIISISIFVLGLINIAIRGISYGIDFKGGTELDLKFGNAVEIAKIREDVRKIGLGNVEVKTLGGANSVLIRTDLQEIPQNLFGKIEEDIKSVIQKSSNGLVPAVKSKDNSSVTFSFPSSDTVTFFLNVLSKAGYQAGKTSEELNNKEIIVRVRISDYIKKSLRELNPGNSIEVRREEIVGPKVGAELKRGAVVAVVLSLLGILLYLAFRFKFIFAAGAVVALFHDVLITLGLYVSLYGLIPGLNLDFDLAVVGAFLTLIGYSVNDTVIVFDRVRETIKLHKNEDLELLMNKAVNQTMSRTILTGGTTLLSCVVLLIFGGEVLRPFAFTLSFGIIIGTYSSVFVASAIVLDYVKKYNKKIEF